MIQNLNKKYFWDGLNNWSDEFIIRRMAEYATIPEIIDLPFDKVRNFLLTFNLNRLRTGTERIEFFETMRPYLQNADNWHEAITRMVDDYFEREYGL